MRLLPDVFEQLSVSIRLLRESSLKTRLAFILIDNVVELTVRAKCNWLAATWWKPLDLRERKRVRGGRFRDLTKVLVQQDVIGTVLKSSLDTCHDIRNLTYHRGDSFESVLSELATFYFQASCDLITCAFGPDPVYFDDDTVAEEVRKLRQGAIELCGEDRINVAHLIQYITSIGPTQEQVLANTLADEVRERVEEFDYALAFIQDHIGDGHSAIEGVQQHWLRALGPKAPIVEYGDEGINYERAWSEYLDEAEKHLPGGRFLTKSPVGTWKKAANRLRHKSSPEALLEYMRVMNDLSPLLDAADDIARNIAQLDDRPD